MLKFLKTRSARTIQNSLLAAVLMFNVSLEVQAQPDDLKHCQKLAIKGGLPADMSDSMYLIEWNYPTYFIGMACTAADSRVKFRYFPGGLFSKPSFQLKGKSTLRVWVKSQTLEAQQVELLIPVEYELNGKSFEVNRSNLQVLTMHLRNVLNNE